MHHGWGHHPGGDSTATANGFHHGFRNDSTHHGFGQHGNWNKDGHQGWANGRDGWKGNHGNRDGWASRGHQGFGQHGHHGFGKRGHQNFGQHGHQGFASRGNHHGFRHHGEGIRYTPEQRKQLMAINKEYKQRSEDLFKQDNLTLKQYKAGLVALEKAKKGKMAALLTPQQKDQVAARRKQMEENRQVMAVAHLERLKLRLNLTDDQVARIKAGQEDLHSQVKAIHENSDLLPQQKREQMKALLAKRNDTYRSVLTPEQYSQFEKMHQHGGFGRPGGFGHPGAGRDGAGTDAI
jgi:hypothetical protein